ncbi:hypothetical protein [Parafrankia sp. EUN1f]|nr:hypothetical protein [Parafrankia sp. EUN1f]EFC80317.1 hypothetical protein FrEUN1fDRAFT_6575 [Parafrankia sp. EUN1f]
MRGLLAAQGRQRQVVALNIRFKQADEHVHPGDAVVELPDLSEK